MISNNAESTPSLITNIHSQLIGQERLTNVVKCLSKSCPWTKTISSTQMLKWLQSEVYELEKELEDLSTLKGKESEDGSTMVDDNERIFLYRKNAAISEMGDILFDALMLEMIMRREYNLRPDEIWNASCQKIERRTPYMKEWGDGISIAHTADEATVLWKKMKKLEKEQELASSSSSSSSSSGSVGSTPPLQVKKDLQRNMSSYSNGSLSFRSFIQKLMSLSYWNSLFVTEDTTSSKRDTRYTYAVDPFSIMIGFCLGLLASIYK